MTNRLEPKKELWFSIGWRADRKLFVFAAVSDNEADAERKLVERATDNLDGPEMNYDTTGGLVIKLDEETGSKLFEWIVGKGVPRQEAVEMVRNIGDQLLIWTEEAFKMHKSRN